MLLHTVAVRSDEEMEDEADAFAGAFLLPASEVRPQLRRFDLRQLMNMKAYWKVSMAALAVRADRLGLITPYQRKSFWMEMGRLGYRRREPNEPPREIPSLLRRMVSFHVKKLGYSVGDLAKLLHLSVDDFQIMYRPEVVGDPGPAPGFLRVVK
jgi:Zn-dependent peptidase ImmA (M78 family)